VASVTPHKTVFLLKLEGLDSLDLAEKYRGADVLIRKETLARKDDEEYFWHELLGLEVRLDSGEYLGTLSRIIPTGSNDIYVVKDGKRESLIPATYEVVKEIDLDAGKMTVSPLEGLLELDEV
jgi:16S rRNA processing protein RimM